jgi:hypothetical protein
MKRCTKCKKELKAIASVGFFFESTLLCCSNQDCEMNNVVVLKDTKETKEDQS